MLECCCPYLFSHFIRHISCVSDFFAWHKIRHIKNANQNKEKRKEKI